MDKMNLENVMVLSWDYSKLQNLLRPYMLLSQVLMFQILSLCPYYKVNYNYGYWVVKFLDRLAGEAIVHKVFGKADGLQRPGEDYAVKAG